MFASNLTNSCTDSAPLYIKQENFPIGKTVLSFFSFSRVKMKLQIFLLLAVVGVGVYAREIDGTNGMNQLF